MAQRLAGRFEARPIAAINMTPLVPVLLVLFAVVAASLPSGVSSLKLDVPPIDPGPREAVPPPLTPFVSVGKGGELWIERTRVDAEHFGPELKALSERRGYNVVLVRAEADTSYGDFMSAVRLIRREGLDVRPVNEDIH